ncbi:MAG: DegT/DnrJ/EryC1/StrS family aminotransferase [Candidatus Omnitrophica bacterium]|nr:DegT/DnrJ/EryC1/StrS family aminotransferase [Candidatus Omnitrophota bacterium]
MMENKIRLSKPFSGNRNKIFKLLGKVLDSGIFVQNKYVSSLEKTFSEFIETKYAIAVSSGTAALHLSLLASNIKQGDEVIVPAYTFPATVNVVELVGAKPVLVDIDLNTYNIDANLIERYITKKTKAIIVVHVFGNPADMTKIMKIAKRYKLFVIEDAAGALGSKFKNKHCGTIGDIGCFSFHPRKIITTGEGGMVVTDQPDIANKISMLRNHGIKIGRARPDIIYPGLNYRMNEFEAILGITQMEKIEQLINERVKLAQAYIKELSCLENVKFQKVLKGCVNSWQAFVIRLSKAENLDSILKKMHRKNIEVNFGTYAIHLLSYYSKKYEIRPSDYPNSNILYWTTMALPFYNGMKHSTIKKVVKELKRILYEI